MSNKKRSSKKNKTSKITLLPQKTKESKLAKYFKDNWKSAATILGIITAIITLYNFFFKPDRKKFEEENIINGKIKSAQISDYTILEKTPEFSIDFSDTNSPPVRGIYIKNLSKKLVLGIQVGGHLFLCSIGDLYHGIDILHPLFSDCSNAELQIVAKDNRLFISAKFVDLRTENEMGEMNFNHWKIYKGNYLDYHYNDSKFEVLDKQGYIPYSISYNEDGAGQIFVTIAGYFISPKAILVFNNEESFTLNHHYVDDHNKECIKKRDSNWLQNSQIEISKIKSIF